MLDKILTAIVIFVISILLFAWSETYNGKIQPSPVIWNEATMQIPQNCKVLAIGHGVVLENASHTQFVMHDGVMKRIEATLPALY